MPMPALIQQNQTGTSAIWFADWMQSPFSLSIGTIATGSPGYNIEFTLDNIDVTTPGGGGGTGGVASTPNATTAANATWFQSAITAQTISTTATITAPVRALRINITTSSSTAFVIAQFIQATYPGS